MCDIVVKKFTFAISSPDEFLSLFLKMSPHSALIAMVKTAAHSMYLTLGYDATEWSNTNRCLQQETTDGLLCTVTEAGCCAAQVRVRRRVR